MQRESSVHILWDDSHIWGLMAWRALRALGVPSRLVKAKEIAQGALSGKPGAAGRARLLLVPGGSARRKAAKLGAAGREAVRDFVRRGGAYLGFCGGAGLALSPAPATPRATGRPVEAPLGLCPWTRAPYAQRIMHLRSGHVLASPTTVQSPALLPFAYPGSPSGRISLPVWWPGRFEPAPGSGVSILAKSLGDGEDLWLVDLPMQSLPARIRDSWWKSVGLEIEPYSLFQQRPLVVTGAYGDGRYVLSYSHLETPDSPDANAWLAHMLRGFDIAVPAGPGPLPQWHLDADGADSRHGEAGDARPAVTLRDARRQLGHLMKLGVEQRLFFRRTPWLWGWRAGVPGIAFNNLVAIFTELSSIVDRLEDEAARPACGKALARIQKRLDDSFNAAVNRFMLGAEDWLIGRRLADMIAPSMPKAVKEDLLREHHDAFFGAPMEGGGLSGKLLQLAEDCLYLAQDFAGTPRA